MGEVSGSMMMQAKTTLRFDEFSNNVSKTTMDVLISKLGDDLKEGINPLELLGKEVLQRINDLATDSGQDVMIKVCSGKNLDFYYLNMTPHDLALNLYLHDFQAFISAECLNNIDSVDKFMDFKGQNVIKPNYRVLQMLEKAIGQYLKGKGKGDVVKIEKYEYENRVIHFAKYGDNLRDISFLEDNKFKNRAMRLARELVFIYYPEMKQLRIKAPTKELKEVVVNNFARYILQDENQFINAQKAKYYDLTKVYELNELNAQVNPDEIEDVTLKELVITNSRENRKVCFSCDDVLSQIDEFEGRIDLYEPIKVKMQFILKGFGRSNRRTIEIADNNTTTLADTPRDNLIFEYLVKCGIAIVD